MHYTKIIHLTLCMALLPLLSFGQEAAPITLDEAVSYAWTHSFTIKNAQIAVADAEEQIVERRSAGIPQLTGNLNYQRYLEVPVQTLPESFAQLISALNPGQEVSREVSFFQKDNFNATLNLDAMVFDGTFFTALKAARAYRAYAAQDMAVQKRTVENQVTNAYLPVLLIDKNIEILDLNISNLENLYRETSELYKEGFVEQLDVDRLQLSLSNLQVEQEKLKRQREVALNGLKMVMNYPLDQELKLVDDLDNYVLTVDDEDIAGAVNMNRRPEVELLNQAIGLSDLNIKVNKVGYYPNVRAFGAYQKQYQGTDGDGFWANNAYIGLTANVPIFDGFFKKAKIQQAKLEQEKTINQKIELEKSIRIEVMNARISFLNAKRTLEEQKRNLDLANRIYDTTQIKYTEGVGSSLEVSDAEQSLYNTQSNYIQALYDVLVAKTALEQALGK